MPLETILFFIAGAVLLIGGAELLVRGASRLAMAAGVSPLVVGLTVVAFGTSSPELAVTVGSAWSGQADVALGNVVGSNIFNVLFILGISALITPLVVAQQLVRLDVPLMIGASLLLLLFGLDGTIGRFDGLFLFLGVVAYTTFLIRQSRRETREVQSEYDQALGVSSRNSWAANIGLVSVGLVLLVLGSRWLVDGAVTMATALGVSQLVIGLTIVAAGTSLPEVATSVLAAIRGERDIAVGNVVGSNIFNLMCVLGVSGAVAPAGLVVTPSMVGFDIPVMIGVAFACLPFFARGYTIPRWQGALILGYYAAYTIYLVLGQTDRDAKERYATAMMTFVIPLTVLTLAVVAWRVLRSRGRPPAG